MLPLFSYFLTLFSLNQPNCHHSGMKHHTPLLHTSLLSYSLEYNFTFLFLNFLKTLFISLKSFKVALLCFLARSNAQIALSGLVFAASQFNLPIYFLKTFSSYLVNISSYLSALFLSLLNFYLCSIFYLLHIYTSKSKLVGVTPKIGPNEGEQVCKGDYTQSTITTHGNKNTNKNTKDILALHST